jgi:hypothetical protein
MPVVETPNVSLVTMLEATSEESVGAFASEVLDGTGFRVDKVSKRSSRLEPPDRYWSMFEIAVSKSDEERRLRLVARGAFDKGAWDELSNRLLRHAGSGRCDPIEGIGLPRLFPETQVAYWFYPFDPALPGLPQATDPEVMSRVLLMCDGRRAHAGGPPRLEIERVRYVPEVAAILRYRFHTEAGPIVIYGKVQPGERGLRAHRIVQGLWSAAARFEEGLINLPHPLGFIPELGLLVEEAIPGKPVGGRRLSFAFQNSAYAAADAIAVVHESGVETDVALHLDHELERLDRVTEQFAYVHPEGHFLLTDLIAHMRKRIEATDEEERLPTHGDLKYDQFMQHNSRFTLLDFDYFAKAETSYDLGKFCGYLSPSIPRSWDETLAAEETRRAFITRYRELRPRATLHRFQIYEALTLALRAMTFMWSHGKSWERMAETFLVMAHERLYSRLPE